MADNENTITVQDRDQRLTFVIRRMEPLRLEQWLVRALSLIVRNPDATEKDYLAAGKTLAEGGVWKLASVAEAEAVQSLTNQLLDCCSRVIDRMEVRCTPENINGFVRDVTTLFLLKNAAPKLNLDFMQRENGTQTGARGQA